GTGGTGIEDDPPWDPVPESPDMSTDPGTGGAGTGGDMGTDPSDDTTLDPGTGGSGSGMEEPEQSDTGSGASVPETNPMKK
ncbi:hypothetical protein ACLESO_26645, partial [Pyxidicoccus sp. 3LG]